MTRPFPTERVFDVHDVGSTLGLRGRGILLLREGRAAARPGDVSLVRYADGHLVHRPVAGDLTDAAVRAAASEPVSALTMHPGGDADAAWLPLSFALHLADHRRRHDPDPITPCVTAVDRPDLPRDGRLVRLPHLLTVGVGDELVDTVVWEVMTSEQAVRWLGSALPDQTLIEAELTTLLHLRRDARDGQYPPAPAGQRLRELLSSRYLSLRLVYRHPDLFQALLEPDRHVPTQEST